MKEIGKTGIKRNRTPENAPENHSKKPKKPQESQTPEYQTNIPIHTTPKENYLVGKKKNVENEQNTEEEKKTRNKGKNKKITNITQANKKTSPLENDKTKIKKTLKTKPQEDR